MHEIGGRPFGLMMFHQIEARAEMRTGPRQDRRPGARAGQRLKDVDQLLDRGKVQRIALGRAVQRDAGDAVRVQIDG